MDLHMNGNACIDFNQPTSVMNLANWSVKHTARAGSHGNEPPPNTQLSRDDLKVRTNFKKLLKFRIFFKLRQNHSALITGTTAQKTCSTVNSD